MIQGLTASDNVTIAIQVNGKRRAKLPWPRMPKAKLSRPPRWPMRGVKRALEGKAPKKVIVVPNRT
jgi:leucyl-tRNA synthetase